MKLLIPELKKLFTIKLLLWMMVALLVANGLLARWHSLSAEKDAGYDGKKISQVVELYASDPEAVEAYADELKEYRRAQSKLQSQAKKEGREFVETRRALYSDGLYTEDLELIDIAIYPQTLASPTRSSSTSKTPRSTAPSTFITVTTNRPSFTAISSSRASDTPRCSKTSPSAITTRAVGITSLPTRWAESLPPLPQF